MLKGGGQPNTLVVRGGNVGIGAAAPTAKLEVAGQIKITGGTPGAGKVLTSDASGLASWQNPTAGGMTTYTFYGGNSCVAGDTELYDGQIATFKSFSATGESLCVDNLAADLSIISSAGYSWGEIAANQRSGRNTINCAVCETTASRCFTYYGSNSCPAGYVRKYAGYITTFSDMDTAGATFCAEGSGFVDTQNNPQQYVWGGTTWNDNAMGCSVCCK